MRDGLAEEQSELAVQARSDAREDREAAAANRRDASTDRRSASEDRQRRRDERKTAVVLVSRPGGVTQTVWDRLHGFDPTHGIRDYDVVYHDPEDMAEASERRIAAGATALVGAVVHDEVTNEARVQWYERRLGRAPCSVSLGRARDRGGRRRGAASACAPMAPASSCVRRSASPTRQGCVRRLPREGR